ncbi:MAG: EI24 domain-containing protein [Pseudomonadota bacterium]
MALISDFFRAIGQIPDRRFLFVFLKALGLTIVLLFAAAAGLGFLASFIPTNLGDWPLIGEVNLPSLGLQGLAVGAVLLASPFLMIPVAAIFVGFFLEEIAAAVEARHYPDNQGRRQAGMGENIGSAVRFMLVVIGINLLVLIPFLILLFTVPPLAAALMVGVNGYLLGREYFELVAVRHLHAKEANALRRRYSFRIWFAGICMTVPLAVPVLNLIIPILGVATITHQFHRLNAVQKAG